MFLDCDTYSTTLLLQHTLPQKQFVSDSEAQALIAEESDGFSQDFFYTNYSIKSSIDDLQEHFIDTLAPFDSLLCGYTNNNTMLPIERAVRMRKINIRANPHGWDPVNKFWKKSYPLPPFMASDIDEDKASSPFRLLFPEYHCHEIHDALDIPRPLVTTINPISGNCQYLYKMRWSYEDEERFAANEDKITNEYNSIWKDLSWLFGSDPGFKNHVVRSPMYIAGHHRNNPFKLTSSKKRIEFGKESLYHKSIWYDAVSYSMSDLQSVIDEFKHLHLQQLGNENVLKTIKRRYVVALRRNTQSI
jgi:hypothetical protein